MYFHCPVESRPQSQRPARCCVSFRYRSAQSHGGKFQEPKHERIMRITRPYGMYTLLIAAMFSIGCGDDSPTGTTNEYKGTEMIIVSVRDTVNNVVADRLQRISFSQDSNALDPVYILDSARLVSSPRAGKMAYLVERPGDVSTIYVADIDGRNVKEIASTNAISRALSYPALSRDGKRVAYATLDRRLLMSNVDGTSPQLLSNNAEFDGVADFSPDGKRIAFYGVDEKLYVVNADGSGERVLATGSQNDLDGRSKVEWSPDGKKIIYVGRDSNGQIDIFVVNADGDPNPTKLTDDDSGDADPTWSPDGTRIAWSSFPGDIYVMNADGTNRRNLTFSLSADDSEPSWSPDGTKIVFSDINRKFDQVIGLLKVYSFATNESRTVAFKAWRGFWGKF